MHSAAPTPALRRVCGTKMRLLHLEAIGLEFFTEGFELAAARRICVALAARQFGLGREFWLRVGWRCADKSSRAREQHSNNAGRQAKSRRRNRIGRAANF